MGGQHGIKLITATKRRKKKGIVSSLVEVNSPHQTHKDGTPMLTILTAKDYLPQQTPRRSRSLDFVLQLNK